MAEPPNALTELLWHKTPEEMYDILKEEQCLSATATQNRNQVITLILVISAPPLKRKKTPTNL